MADDKLGALLHLLHIGVKELKREESFGLKMRVQRVVYLLQYVGETGFSFSFSTYFRGPYSVDLAKRCSLMEDEHGGAIENAELAVWFYDHELEWLTVATTILMAAASGESDKGKMEKTVRFYRERLTGAQFESVYSTLAERGILR